QQVCGLTKRKIHRGFPGLVDRRPDYTHGRAQMGSAGTAGCAGQARLSRAEARSVVFTRVEKSRLLGDWYHALLKQHGHDTIVAG
ncbi:MAG: hypothetical protein V4637_16255, partial [Pseudomonadota bacterium]